ncbi:MAG: MBL fold metallo-hydrolase, partial [Mesorhizobium sp.]
KTYLIAFEEELAKSKDAASLKAAMEARFTLGGRKRATG